MGKFRREACPHEMGKTYQDSKPMLLPILILNYYPNLIRETDKLFLLNFLEAIFA